MVVFGGTALWEVTGLPVRMKLVLLEKRQWLLHLFSPVRTQRRWLSRNQENESSPDTQCTFILDLLASRTVRINFWGLKAPPVCDILLQEPEWTSIQWEASLLMPPGALSAHARHPYFCSPAWGNVTWHWDSVDEFFSYFPLTGSLITVNFAIPAPGAFVFFILLHSFSRSESKQRTPFTFSCKRVQT